VYEAEGLVLLTDPRTNGTTATELSIFWNPTRYLENQVAVMTSPNVTDRAAEILGSPWTGDDVAESIDVRSENDIDALTVSAQSNVRSEPIPVVDAVVEAYGEVVSEEVIKNADDTVAGLQVSKDALTSELEDIDQQLSEDPDNAALQAALQSTREALLDVSERINSIQTNALLYGTGIQLYVAPKPPAIQVAPSPMRTAAIAFVLAALAAGAYAWWRAENDQRADTKDAPAGVLDAPLLATVPDFSSAHAWAPAPTVTHPESSAAEAYHFAVSSLAFVMNQRDAKSVVITSARPGDGKTVTALNLAIAAMKDGRRPLLVDGDERAQGLTILAGVSDTRSPNGSAGEGYLWTITPDENLDFVAAGRSLGSDVAGYFRSAQFREQLHHLMENRHLVIIDAPPVMSAAETAQLAAEADGVVIVVERGTPLRQLADARDRLALSGTPVVGYIYNRASVDSGYYAYYGTAKPAPKEATPKT